MDSMQRGIVTLIRSAITGEKYDLPPEFDITEAYPQLKRHQVIPLAYIGVVNCGLDKSLPQMQTMFQAYLRSLFVSEGQVQAIRALCTAFDDAGIDYMPLKGCNLKFMYPKPELRQMGDADILIRTAQYEQVKPIVTALGYTEQDESDHELIWHSKSLHLELHKRLIPSYNKDYYRYFGDGWRLASPVSGTRYGMSKEDEFIYLFTHFAKHYRDGGIGLRHVTDLWVYRRANPQLDEGYVTKELEKLQLLAFYQNILSLLAVWFADAPSDEKTEFMTNFLFDSGSWGSAENHAVSSGVKHAADAGSVGGGTVKQYLEVIFPKAIVLQKRYPVLKKYPALLPVFWPVRWVTALLFRRHNIRAVQSKLDVATPDKIETYQQALNYVGLDFHFKE